jgi:hypothetical protein
MSKMGEVFDFQSRRDEKSTGKKIVNTHAPERKFLLGKQYFIANHETGSDEYPVIEVNYSGIKPAGDPMLPLGKEYFLFQTPTDSFGMATMMASENGDDVFDTREEAVAAFYTFFDELIDVSTASADAFIKYSAETILRNLSGKRIEVYLDGMKQFFPVLYAELLREGKLNDLNM